VTGKDKTATGTTRLEERPNLEYWAATACGSIHTTASPQTKEYYDEADAFRYGLEPVAEFARFHETAGLRVLEVGTGMGGDLARFLTAGADALGVDLSPTAVATTRNRLKLWGVPPRVIRGDALALPLPTDTFDLVWSWGVLHHTGNIERAVDEVFRVTKPGGRIRLMLYHRPSWVAFAAWVRWGLLRGRLRGMKRIVAEHVQGPGTLALTRPEIRRLLSKFEDVDVRVIGTYWDRKFVPGLGSLAGSALGWFALMEARKPETSNSP
jgi:SAM-dependent methyltransferase